MERARIPIEDRHWYQTRRRPQDFSSGADKILNTWCDDAFQAFLDACPLPTTLLEPLPRRAIDMHAVQQDVDAWRKVKAYDDANTLHAEVCAGAPPGAPSLRPQTRMQRAGVGIALFALQELWTLECQRRARAARRLDFLSTLEGIVEDDPNVQPADPNI